MSDPTTDNAGPRPLTGRGAVPLLRNTWLVIAALAFTALGVAAGLAWRPSNAPATGPGAEATAASMVSTKSSLAPHESLVETAPATQAAASTGPTDGSPTPAAPSAERATATAGKTVPARQTTRHAAASPQRASTSGTGAQQAAVCKTCGVVESVREITIKGKGTGLGAVAGGVIGGAVGNKMGGGNGRTAMTVLGAIGGGYAGNEVEKYARRTTAYDVTVRMDDGSTRTLRQQSAPAVGSKVTVRGDSLRVAHAAG